VVTVGGKIFALWHEDYGEPLFWNRSTLRYGREKKAGSRDRSESRPERRVILAARARARATARENARGIKSETGTLLLSFSPLLSLR